MERPSPEAAKEFILSMPIERLELDERTVSVLKREGIDSVGQLVQCSPEDLMNIRNFGREERVNLLRAELAKYDLRLRDDWNNER